MVVAQNKKLVVYTNKLKSYLAKSFKAMERVDNIQVENKDLKQENKRLKEYLEHTFEYVSLLFDFSKNRLKRLVDTFVNSLNKEKDK